LGGDSASALTSAPPNGSASFTKLYAPVLSGIRVHAGGILTRTIYDFKNELASKSKIMANEKKETVHEANVITRAFLSVRNRGFQTADISEARSNLNYGEIASETLATTSSDCFGRPIAY
jgi:hypothetical protein